MSTAMMAAPSSASRPACLRPWPRPAPVTKATLPCTRPMRAPFLITSSCELILTRTNSTLISLLRKPHACSGKETGMHRMLIDGKLVAADRTYPSVNPATGEVLDQAPDPATADAQAAIAAARRAFDTT